MKEMLLTPLLVFANTAFAGPDLTYSTPCDPRNQTATLSFVGDILIHDMLYKSVVAGSKDFSQIWRRTNSLMQKADASIGNLEGPAALGIDRQGRDHGDVGFTYDLNIYSGTNMVFNFHPRILSDLKKSGYDLLTVANNHSLDRYSIGVDRTVQAARNIGLPTVGTRIAQERNAEFYQILNIRNMRVAFLGCTEMTNGRTDSKDQLLLCYSGEKIRTLIRDLSSRSDVDAVIVLPHWGVEYSSKPDAKQKSHAKMFLEAGATAVVGSHPHVLQPWEKYVTTDGRETLVIYSLGNFVAFQKDVERKTGAVAYIGLAKEGNRKATIFGVGYTPTYRDGYEVYPVGAGSFKDAQKHAAQMFGTRGRIEPASTLLPALCGNGP
ncbi:MAG: capsular biosynthesis protein [Bdellovibrio sp. ArHS]|uniref:CapA family protein n=1 Tax=Bdellovibrio sp. ArHS TaxID=1569284 RepID=UPI000583C53E|nr:CapA family protein [Bdellovibrio sp. ArHS]KHD87630.1 MAG: capsular biosynthesis protein [Bdellovibrio sp. ArHS]